MAVGFSLLMARLIDLQVIHSQAYRELADSNRHAVRLKPKERGVILDRYGDPLVLNIPKYFRQDTITDGSQKRLLDESEALSLMATKSAEVGYEIERRYLYPESTAHVLGYTGKPTAQDLLNQRELSPNDLVGKSGLEAVYDPILRGVAQQSTYEVNALGQLQRVLTEKAGVPGATIWSSIDPYLSEVAYKALAGQRGAVVILDTATGEILTLISKPSFSATKLTERQLDPQAEQARQAEVRAFFSHPQQLFFNRAVSGTYPPGSIFKLVTALAGLEKGSVTSETTVNDEGVLKVGEYEYANWYFTQYGGVEGTISLERALARSNDIFFYKAAEWVGPTALAEYAQLMGFGEQTGIELPGEAEGLVPDPVWKEQQLGEQWFLGNTYHFGIGQGDVLISPLQAAQMVQVVGNKGTLCQPHLVRAVGTSGQKKSETSCSELGLKEEHLEVVMQGMVRACSTGGTAYPFFTHNELYAESQLPIYQQLDRGAVACKTGTAEFGSANEKGYRATHGWFVASLALTSEGVEGLSQEAVASDSASVVNTEVSPDDDMQEIYQKWRGQKAEHLPKKISLAVLVESDEQQPYKEGSRDAAPVAKFILDWMQGKSPSITELTKTTDIESE